MEAGVRAARRSAYIANGGVVTTRFKQIENDRPARGGERTRGYCRIERSSYTMFPAVAMWLWLQGYGGDGVGG
jgi:hypothetical protein